MRTKSLISSPLVMFALLAVALLAAESWIAGTADFAAHPDVLALAVTADIVVGIPLAYYLLVVRRKGLPAITVAPVFILSLLAAGRILPAAHHTYLRYAELAAPLVELIVLIIVAAKLRQIVRHYRHLRPAYVYFPETLEASVRAALPAFPPAFASLLTTELSLVVFGLTGWLRRAPAGDGDRPRFSYHRQGGYAVILGFLTFVLVLETTVLHLLVTRWNPTVAWVLTIASVYTLFWVFGDFHASRLQPITLDDACLRLRVGMRWRIDVPWSQVEMVRKATAADKKLPDFINLAVMGEPRLMIVLRQPLIAQGLLGRTRETAHVGLSVDDETAFLRAIDTRLALAPQLSP